MRHVKLTEKIQGQGIDHDAVVELNEIDRGEGGMGLKIELNAPSPMTKDDLDPILRLLYRGLSTYMEEFEPDHTEDGECMCEDCLAEEFAADLDDLEADEFDEDEGCDG